MKLLLHVEIRDGEHEHINHAVVEKKMTPKQMENWFTWGDGEAIISNFYYTDISDRDAEILRKHNVA